MSNPNDVQNWIGHTAVDADGNKIGKIGQIYLDDSTGSPTWVTVSTGMFGTKESFAPLYGSSVSGEDLKLAVTKDLVKDAPNVDADQHMDDNDIDALLNHYEGHLGTTDNSVTDTTVNQHKDYAGTEQTGAAQTGEVGGPGHDTSGRNTDEAMTRSEERLHVGTENVESGRARLRKYVVTENVTKTVPVSHEEVRLQREPITEANRGAATDGPAISEEEHEVTLHAERPVVSKETVPVERVRLETETVTEQQQVDETLRKEQIDELDVDRPADRTV